MDTCITTSACTKGMVYLYTCHLCFYVTTVHIAHGGRCTCFANICRDAGAVLQEREAWGRVS